jgi:hypothetical protein
MLTDGKDDDFDPCALPCGRLAFISTRRGGFGRCHARPVPTYTLFSMKNDGSDVICLSYHETNEWQPSVDNNGMILYTRWDYVDRDHNVAHHYWITYPDGRDPRSYHGNYPLPLETSQTADVHLPDGRKDRPFAEFSPRAIPNSSKLVATASAHHGQNYGCLVLIDPTVPDDGKMAQVIKITADAKFPECDGSQREYWPYGTAYPLSQDYYFANYNNTIVLLDRFGNRDQIYQCPMDGFRPVDPIPVCVRTVPPVIPTQTYQGERSSISAPTAVMSVLNVYNSDIPFPAGTKIKSMRIVQIFPKSTFNVNDPWVGLQQETLCRMVLGTVPVEDDGSVYCEAPVGKAIYFQLLDDKGQAVQSMRSDTYVHPGENLSCFGCHEDKWKSLSLPGTAVKALQRAPSPLTPEIPSLGVAPLTYAKFPKPVFDAKCAPCHRDKGKGPDFSYGNASVGSGIEKYAFYYNGWDCTPFAHAGSRSVPGNIGAKASLMYAYLNSLHYAVWLTQEELLRVTMWLDNQSVRYGAYENLDAQDRGETVWPVFDVDPQNPTGIEKDRAAAARLFNSSAAAAPGPIFGFVHRGTRLFVDHSCFPVSMIKLFDARGRRLSTHAVGKSLETTIINLPTCEQSSNLIVSVLFNSKGMILGTKSFFIQ